jgi:dephospho-CoA kinase
MRAVGGGVGWLNTIAAGCSVKFAGLTGVIGAGKSTVGAGLAALGAAVIDVDKVSRELQEPGQPFYEQIVARWGEVVVGADGRLDREALAVIVFSDRAQLGELTMMAAPLTEQELVRRASAHSGTDTVVVAEAALYLAPMYGMTGLAVVDVPVEVAVTRLVSERGMSETDARARIASQIPREVRLEHAGFVVDNSGPREDLPPRIDALFAWLQGLPDATPTVDRQSTGGA